MKNTLLFFALGTLSFSTGATAEEVAKVKLDPKSGSAVHGLVLLKAVNDGVSLIGEVGGFKPGSDHGFHIHEKADCSAADAASAGGHWNPEGKKHGDSHPKTQSSHAGDLGNLSADQNGVAKIDLFLRGYRLMPGSLSLKGHSFVVHEDKDDFKTQPTGNSGKRVACGVIP